MSKASATELIAAIEKHGVAEAARLLGMTERGVYSRRARLEQKIGRQIKSGGDSAETDRTTRRALEHPSRLHLDVDDGIVLIGSDAHYWPDIISTAHIAMVQFARDIQPRAIIMNGDAADFPRISRHAPIGWENHPDVVLEIEAIKDRLGEIEKAAPNAKKFWPLGNHDNRYETRLATIAPEYARMNGFSLRDHFPYWRHCWSVWINDHTIVKHRFKGGLHAAMNNTLWAGKSIFTGHLHRGIAYPLTDYNGTRYGVDTGFMADNFGPQFINYTEDNPTNWCSGFFVVTLWRGRLLRPEFVEVIGEGLVSFRGQAIEVRQCPSDATTTTPTGKKPRRTPAK